jgi:hypothetical protein
MRMRSNRLRMNDHLARTALNCRSDATAHLRQHVPPMDAAAGLREYRRRAALAAGGGGLAFIVGGWLIDTVGDIGGAVAVFGMVALTFGVVGLVRVARVYRLASRSGWRPRKAAFNVVGGGNGQPALVLMADGGEPEAVLAVATTVFRWGALHGAESLWVTGNPLSRFAAVATPDGAHVVVVKRPLLPWWRARLRRIATGI